MSSFSDTAEMKAALDRIPFANLQIERTPVLAHKHGHTVKWVLFSLSLVLQR